MRVSLDDRAAPDWRREITALPNLVSVARIALVVPLAIVLANASSAGDIAALVIMGAAIVSDGLDGFLARRKGRITSLGIALDPIADKVFAGVLVLLLFAYRDLPLWMALVILGRDVLIVAGGMVILKRRRITVPANLTGKYTFAAISLLLISYLIRFPFGIELSTYLTLLLVVASLLSYGRVFMHVRRVGVPPVFVDKPVYRMVRLAAALGVVVVYATRLYLDLIR